MVMVHCQSGICVDPKGEIEALDRSETVYAFFFLVPPRADEGEHLPPTVDEPCVGLRN
jgi:hypothetical protein